ncbi:MAG: hypothetical protein N2515_07005, partial [Deltaproteobacteria bacterium]|nr:hypothetical protein [Deltaproteobacteria bacterium]
MMVELSLEELVDGADLIVRGHALGAGSLLVIDGDGALPHTRTFFEVLETLKGEHKSHLTIDEPGGEVQGRRALLPGTPEYRPGAQYIAFLKRLPQGFY